MKKNELLNNDFDSSDLKNTQKLEFRHSLRTISKVSIIFAFATLFIFIQYFYFEKNLQLCLQYKSQLVHSIMSRKILITRLGFFVLETDIDNTNCSLATIFPYYNGLGSTNSSIIAIYNELLVYIEKMEDPTTKELLSPVLLDDIFNSYSSNYSFLAKGTLNALIYFSEESLFYGLNNYEYGYASLYKYYSEASALYDALDDSANMDNIVMTNSINSQLNSLYYFNAGFGALFLIMYAVYYYPMLSSDINFLKKLTDIILIIPKNQIVLKPVKKDIKSKIRFTS